MSATVYFCDKIITLDDSQSTGEAVVVEGGKIAAVGGREEIRRRLRADDEAVELSECVMLPAFIDAHVHAVWTGMGMMGVDLIGKRSIDEILDAVADYARNTQSEWIFGNGYDESIIAEGRPPNRWLLDRVSGGRPVLLRQRGGHSCVVNSRALKLLRLPRGLEGRGDDGVLHGAANRLALEITGAMFSADERFNAVQLTAEAAMKAGIACIHCMQRPNTQREDDITLRMAREDLPIRLVIYPTTEDVKWVKRHGFARIGGCMLLDGAIDSRTAAFFEPYLDEPENYGVLNYTDEQLADFLRRAHEAGLQVAVHAIGERAIEQMLNAIEKAAPDSPPLSFRIEHFIFPTKEQIARAAELGVGICVQPSFEALWGGAEGWFARFVGRDRMMRSTPLRDLFDAGLNPAGGSDSPVSPLDALFGIHAAVNHPNESQRITVQEALKMFTVNAARIAHSDGESGTIEAGKNADMVLLSENPLEVAPEKLKEIRVRGIIISGEGLIERGRDEASLGVDSRSAVAVGCFMGGRPRGRHPVSRRHQRYDVRAIRYSRFDAGDSRVEGMEHAEGCAARVAEVPPGRFQGEKVQREASRLFSVQCLARSWRHKGEV